MRKCSSTILYAACTFRPYKSTPVLKLFRTFTGRMTKGLSLRMVFSLLFQDTLFTVGGSRDTTIPSPGWSPKQSLPGIGLHDPLHGREACPEFNSFYQGVGQMCHGRGYFRAVPCQSGDKFVISPTPSIVEQL